MSVVTDGKKIDTLILLMLDDSLHSYLTNASNIPTYEWQDG